MYAILFPSIIWSSTPVTVIVWGVSQLEVVKIIVVVDNIASLESDPETETTTFVMGCVSSTTVKVSVVPDSETAVAPFDSTTIIFTVGAGGPPPPPPPPPPEVSLSTVVAVTV